MGRATHSTLPCGAGPRPAAGLNVPQSPAVRSRRAGHVSLPRHAALPQREAGHPASGSAAVRRGAPALAGPGLLWPQPHSGVGVAWDTHGAWPQRGPKPQVEGSPPPPCPCSTGVPNFLYLNYHLRLAQLPTTSPVKCLYSKTDRGAAGGVAEALVRQRRHETGPSGAMGWGQARPRVNKTDRQG